MLCDGGVHDISWHTEVLDHSHLSSIAIGDRTRPPPRDITKNFTVVSDGSAYELGRGDPIKSAHELRFGYVSGDYRGRPVHCGVDRFCFRAKLSVNRVSH